LFCDSDKTDPVPTSSFSAVEKEDSGAVIETEIEGDEDFEAQLAKRGPRRGTITVMASRGVVGWLNKYSGQGGFRRRWFQLRGECLIYFETETSTDPKGFIWLDGAVMVKNARLARRDALSSLVTRGRDLGTAHTVVIRRFGEAGTAWELCAADATELEMWLAALTLAGVRREPDAPIPEEEEDKVGGYMDAARAHLTRLNDSIDHEAVKTVARAAAPHVGRAILHAVPHGHLIAKGVGAIGKAAGRAADSYAASLAEEEDKVTDTLLVEFATRLSRTLFARQLEGKQVITLPPPTPGNAFEPDPLVLDTLRQICAERKEARLKTARALARVADVTGQAKKSKEGGGEGGDEGGEEEGGSAGPNFALLESLAGASGAGGLMGLAASLARSHSGGGGGGAAGFGGGLNVAKLAGLVAKDRSIDPASIAALARVTVALENPEADAAVESDDGERENQQAADAMHSMTEEQIREALVSAGHDPDQAAAIHASLQAASRILAKSSAKN
jgi:PH domain